MQKRHVIIISIATAVAVAAAITIPLVLVNLPKQGGSSSSSSPESSSSVTPTSSSESSSSIHAHTFSPDWTYDETNHWHAATCGHDVKGSEAPHSMGEWTVTTAPGIETNGEETSKCTVCDYSIKRVVPYVGTPEKLRFSLNDDGESYSVRAKHPSISGEVVIPEIYEGKPVTAIKGDDVVQYGAFYNCNSVTSISIPNTIERVGRWTFDNCDALNFTSKGNANYLGNKANPYLMLIKADNTDITSCEIESGCKIIFDEAFEGCTLLSSVTIPEGVKYINYFAFNNCEALTSITLPSTLELIGEWAFGDCTGVASINIPNSVTNIEYGAFGGLGSWSATYTLYENGYYLGNSDNPYLALAKYKDGDQESFVVNENCKFILGEAFDGYTALTSVTLPDGLLDIGNFAFDSCSSLSSITIPSTVYHIGRGAFIGCNGLTSAILPSNIDKIEEIALQDCEALTSITIPEGVKVIEGEAFKNCTSLSSVTLPNSLQTVEEGVFNGCTSLTYNVYDNGKYLGNDNNPHLALIEKTSADITSCNIHNDTKVIASKAFIGCTELTSIVIPEGVKHIYGYTFDSCSKLSSITLPKSLEGIDDSAFNGCTALTTINFAEGSSLRYISRYAFSECDALSSFIVPDGATDIYLCVFDSCPALTSVTLPNSLEFIDDYLFEYSPAITSIAYKGTLEEWNNLAKPVEHSKWGAGIPASITVHCTDRDTTI